MSSLKPRKEPDLDLKLFWAFLVVVILVLIFIRESL
jgi:hypothetical protein